MDVNKLTTGDKVVFGSALVFLISIFLPWFKFDFGISEFGGLGEVSAKGSDVGFLFSWFPLLLAIVMVVQICLERFSPDTQLPELPITYGQLHMGLGGLAALLLVLKLLTGETGFDRSYGLFLAVLAAIGLAAGGFLKMQEPEAASAGGGGGTAPPTPF